MKTLGLFPGIFYILMFLIFIPIILIANNKEYSLYIKIKLLFFERNKLTIQYSKDIQ